MTRPRIDWDALEPHYRAGIRALKDLGKEFGCSDAAIIKHARDKGWTRNLKAKIQAKADAKVSAALVSAEVSETKTLTEATRIEVEAEVQARIRLTHRKDIGRGRDLVMKLLTELEQVTDNHGTFQQLLEALAAEGEDEDRRKRLWEQWQKAVSLGPRADTLKKLVETLRALIDKEREAFGINEVGQGSGGFEKWLESIPLPQ